MVIMPETEAAFRRYMRSLRRYEAAYRAAYRRTGDLRLIEEYHESHARTQQDLRDYEALVGWNSFDSELSCSMELGLAPMLRVAQTD